MTDLTMTKTRLFEGVWEGTVTGPASDTPPMVIASHLNKRIEGLELTTGANPGEWIARMRVPVDLIGEGLQTFLFVDGVTGETLASFALLAGDALAEDIRAEVDLLRAELDMLKKAFRRHCVETA